MRFSAPSHMGTVAVAKLVPQRCTHTRTRTHIYGAQSEDEDAPPSGFLASACGISCPNPFHLLQLYLRPEVGPSKLSESARDNPSAVAVAVPASTHVSNLNGSRSAIPSSLVRQKASQQSPIMSKRAESFERRSADTSSTKARYDCETSVECASNCCVGTGCSCTRSKRCGCVDHCLC